MPLGIIASYSERFRNIQNVVLDATASSTFEVGERVFHQKFGYGNIQDIEGDKLQIEFDKAGNKKVVSKFIVSADHV